MFTYRYNMRRFYYETVYFTIVGCCIHCNVVSAGVGGGKRFVFQSPTPALISEYFKAIGEQDYSSGFKLLSAGQRELMKSVEAQNSAEKEGIWSVSSVNSAEIMCDATGQRRIG